MASRSLWNFECPSGTQNFKIGFSKPILSPLWTWENFPLTLHISFLTSQRENIKNKVLSLGYEKKDFEGILDATFFESILLQHAVIRGRSLFVLITYLRFFETLFLYHSKKSNFPRTDLVLLKKKCLSQRWYLSYFNWV